MSQLVNKIVIEGNLTADPDTKLTTGGNCLTKISVAVNDRIKKADNWETETDYFNCEFWGKQAERLAEWAKKGDKIRVSGKMKCNQYKNAEGVNVRWWYIKADFQDGFKLYNTKKSDGEQKKQSSDDPLFKAREFGIESDQYKIVLNAIGEKVKNKNGLFVVVDKNTGEIIDVPF